MVSPGDTSAALPILALKQEKTSQDNKSGTQDSGCVGYFTERQITGENSVGIGLALAKAIFTAQGGDISVRSEPGVGPSFEIRIFREVV